MLLLQVDPAATSLEAGVSYAVALIDEDGRIRWRADVPSAPTATPDDRLHLTRFGAVAMSAHRVVLRALDNTLVAWDAASGRRIAG